MTGRGGPIELPGAGLGKPAQGFLRAPSPNEFWAGKHFATASAYTFAVSKWAEQAAAGGGATADANGNRGPSVRAGRCRRGRKPTGRRGAVRRARAWRVAGIAPRSARVRTAGHCFGPGRAATCVAATSAPGRARKKRAIASAFRSSTSLPASAPSHVGTRRNGPRPSSAPARRRDASWAGGDASARAMGGSVGSATAGSIPPFARRIVAPDPRTTSWAWCPRADPTTTRTSAPRTSAVTAGAIPSRDRPNQAAG